MGKTWKDQQRWEGQRGKKLGRTKFPRVPPIKNRSEPFEDKRRKSKYGDQAIKLTNNDYDF